MRIGVDGTGWANRRGHGRFTRNVVGRLVDSDVDVTYVVYVDKPSAHLVDLPQSAELRAVPVSRATSKAAASDSRRRVVDLVRLAWAVSRDKPDVVLFPSLYTYFPVFGLPTVVGVHDTIAEDFPNLTLPTRRARLYWSAKRRLALGRAARLFTVSEAARADLVERFGLSADRIAVVPEAPDAVFGPRGADDVERALAPLGLQVGSFFVFAGGISPHKNLEAPAAGHGAAPRPRRAPQLAIVGDPATDGFVASHASLSALRESRLGLGDAVTFTRYVSGEHLRRLVHAASVAVLPSLAEGFGLPAVEAAACGAPVRRAGRLDREAVGGPRPRRSPTDRERSWPARCKRVRTRPYVPRLGRRAGLEAGRAPLVGESRRAHPRTSSRRRLVGAAA